MQYVKSITDRRVVLVGHSLGGGLAQIAGALSGAPCASFSGPGILDTRSKFGLSRTDLVQSVINVIPSHDVVPLAGLLGGTVVAWDCPLHAFACHMPMLPPCGMHALCPSLQPTGMHCHVAGSTMSTVQRLRSLV